MVMVPAILRPQKSLHTRNGTSWNLLLFAISCFISLRAVAGATANPDGRARDGSIVIAGNARFTLLTPALIRLEWRGPDGFVDQPSLVFQVC